MYKDTEKIDKGFVLNYNKLSYRRKFIWNLVWGIPIIIGASIAIYLVTNLSTAEYIILGMAFLVLFLLEVTYNYVKWKRTEQNF